MAGMAGWLTWDGVKPPVRFQLVAARGGAQGFVAHAHEDDGEQAEEQAGRGPDVPLLEDDAEVGRVPGEEHLFVGWSPPLSNLLVLLICDLGCNGSLTLMLHLSPCDGMSWPPWPGMSPMSPWPIWEWSITAIIAGCFGVSEGAAQVTRMGARVWNKGDKRASACLSRLII